MCQSYDLSLSPSSSVAMADTDPLLGVEGSPGPEDNFLPDVIFFHGKVRERTGVCKLQRNLNLHLAILCVKLKMKSIPNAYRYNTYCTCIHV